VCLVVHASQFELRFCVCVGRLVRACRFEPDNCLNVYTVCYTENSYGYAFMVGFGSVRDVRILMVSRNERLPPPGGPLRNYILQLGRRSGTT
jgi:hypothetical protein